MEDADVYQPNNGSQDNQQRNQHGDEAVLIFGKTHTGYDYAPEWEVCVDLAKKAFFSSQVIKLIKKFCLLFGEFFRGINRDGHDVGTTATAF